MSVMTQKLTLHSPSLAKEEDFAAPIFEQFMEKITSGDSANPKKLTKDEQTAAKLEGVDIMKRFVNGEDDKGKGQSLFYALRMAALIYTLLETPEDETEIRRRALEWYEVCQQKYSAVDQERILHFGKDTLKDICEGKV